MTQQPAKLLSLAASLLKAGRHEEAIMPLRQALSLQPANARVAHDLGVACLEAGRAGEAAEALRAAVAADPRYTDAHFRLGLALEKLDDAAGAITAYDRATELLPSLTEAWFRAGALIYPMGFRDQAIACFRRAASSGPKTRYGRLGAARALLAEDRDAEAEIVLRRALALDPGCAMAQDLLGHVLAEAGKFEAARACFARAIAAAPLLAGCYYDLARCRRVTAEDGDLPGRMEAALATPGLEPGQIFRIHLALGKAWDDLGAYGRAMRHFDAADAVRRAGLAFDPAAFAAQVERIIGQFTPDLFAQEAALGSADATPLLIIGMPRSGTTLVEQILSCHQQVAAGGELNFWSERGIAWSRLGAAAIAPEFARRCAADYLALLRGIGPEAARVTDKRPFNFIWAGLIHLVFPKATIIHCRRAPIDTALSIHQTHFNPRLAFPTGGRDLVGYFEGYRRLVAHWRAVLPAERFIDIDYEKLTGAPEPEIRRIVAAAGLVWDEACLHPERNTRVVKTASKWQARQPIYRDAVARWRRYEPFLGELRALVEGEDVLS